MKHGDKIVHFSNDEFDPLVDGKKAELDDQITQNLTEFPLMEFKKKSMTNLNVNSPALKGIESSI